MGFEPLRRGSRGRRRGETTRERDVGMKRAQVCFDSRRKQEIVDALAKLEETGMTGAVAEPEHTRRRFRRKCTGAFERQQKQCNVYFREPRDQRLDFFNRSLAEETQRDVQLFEMGPPQVASLGWGHQFRRERANRVRQGKCDEEAFGGGVHAVKFNAANSTLNLAVRGYCQLKLKLTLIRSSSTRLAGTSWRSQLSKRMTLPASAG